MLDTTFYYSLRAAMRPIFMTVVDNDRKLYRRVKKSFQARTLDMTSIAMDIIEFDPVKVGFTHKPGITVRDILDSVARHCDAGDEPGVTASYYIPGEDDEGAYDFYYTEADWEYDPGLLDLLTLDLHMPFSEDSGKLRARLNRRALDARYGDTLFTEIDNVISLSEDEIAPRYRISCKHRQEGGQHILNRIDIEFHATDTCKTYTDSSPVPPTERLRWYPLTTQAALVEVLPADLKQVTGNTLEETKILLRELVLDAWVEEYPEWEDFFRGEMGNIPVVVV
jgi:hypothetical protein